MLDQLPAEITESILSHLPTVSAITNVSLTSKTLYETVKNGQNTIFHDFVERQFPTIPAHGPWRETAFQLTSRSRAWDRRAFIARECLPPGAQANDRDSQRVVAEQHVNRQTFGYIPVIDSYEATGAEGDREVLAWGAAGRLRVRISEGKSVRWTSLCSQDDFNPQTDILDLRLLRPHQNRNRFGESALIRRANRELALLNGMPEQDHWVAASTYLVKPESAIECIDISEDTEPLLAVCNSTSLQLFPVHTLQEQSRATTVVPLAETSTTKQRKRCAKFLSSSKIAIAPQFLTGLQPAPIEIFNISESSLVASALLPVEELSVIKHIPSPTSGRIGANVLTKLDDRSQNSGELLLTGWSDGLVRLYDLRAGQTPVREFSDPVDDGQIFSLLSIGRERFLAGSHQNGCLKTFDMRMNGRVYDYTEVARSSSAAAAANAKREEASQRKKSGLRTRSAREVNIYLALSVRYPNRQWRPLPGRQQNARLPRYNGSIYSLSSPSATSPHIYLGIENHVIQLDTISTDDWLANRGGMQKRSGDSQILDLSCYERPREGRESTDVILLRKQRGLSNLGRLDWTDAEAGWDERWYLEQRRTTRKGMAASWRSGRPG